MLHCASVAAVVRPLALVAGALAVAAVGTGVAQIHGMVCEPSRIGPPLGWFVTVRRELTKLPSLALAVIALAPSLSPVTRPTMRPSARFVNAEVTSVPLTSTLRLDALPIGGVLISTRTSPPETRSARFDSVVIVGATPALLPPPPPPPQAARTAETTTAANAAGRERHLFT